MNDYSDWARFEATAYVADCYGCTGITKTGRDVRHTTTDDAGRTIIAVDPREIPLGTSIQVRLSDGTVIEGIADDVGGAIKGRKIDVLMAKYDEAVAFGRQGVEVRVKRVGADKNETEECGMSGEKVTVLRDETIGGVEREYVEVDRQAAVGERIKIVNAGFAGRPPVYKNGDVLTVTGIDEDGYREIDRNFNDGSQGIVCAREYVVLEPTDTVRVNSERFRMVEQKAAEGDKILVVSDKTGNSERYFIVKVSVGIVAEVVDRRSFSDRVYVNGPEVEGGPWYVHDKDIRVLKPEVVDATNTRQAVIKRAKTDVVELITKDSGRFAVSPHLGHVTVEFVVNRDKRTVTALLRLAYTDTAKVYERGIAKAAPGDCFNIYIGKAIALRRALMLPIPDEYVNAPQPSEPRVGDIVESTNDIGNVFSFRVDSIDNDKLRGTLDGWLDGYMYKNAGDRYGAPCTNPRVIDDSREGIGDETDPKTPVTKTFKPGDRVRIIGNGAGNCRHYYVIGSVGTVWRMSGEGNYKVYDDKRPEYFQYVSPRDLEAA